MILTDVLAQVMAAAATVDGLRVPPRWGDRPPQPPIALVELPEQVIYDVGGVGFVRLPDLPLVVVCGDPTRPETFRRAAAFLDTRGSGSVKAAVEAYPYTACGAVRVGSATPESVELSGHQFFAVTFHVDVAGMA